MEENEFKYFSNKDLDRIDENYMDSIFDEIIEKNQFGTVLDYGCGNGIFGIYIKQKANCRIIGIDGSPYALKGAEEIGYDETFCVNDFCQDKIPMNDESVDFVISKDIIEHLLDPVFMLKEIHRVCRKNGLLLLHVPNHFPLLYRLKFLFTNDIDTQNFFPDASDWDFPHIRFYRHRNVIQKLEEIGFEMVEDFSQHFTVYFPKTARVPGLKQLQYMLSKKYPDHFSIGFTLLFRKK